MRIVILPTEVEASNFAAEFIAEFINNNKNPVVGMATGSRPDWSDAVVGALKPPP